jgi:predicted nucleic acid-binding protein
VTLLDSYAVLALLKGEPAADQVQQLLAEDSAAALTVLGVAELLDHLVRLVGVEEDAAVLDLAQLGLLAPAVLTADVALQAGLLRASNYHRRDRAISLADCVLAASARASGSPVATADPHLLDTCRAEGIGVMPLPDAQGRTWSPDL